MAVLGLSLYLGLANCFSFFLFRVMKDPDQSNTKEVCYWGYSFRSLDPMMVEQRHGSRNSCCVTSWSRSMRLRAHWKWQESLETSKPTSNGTPPPIRPRLLILPKHWHLGTKVLKHMSLWGPVSVRPPQILSMVSAQETQTSPIFGFPLAFNVFCSVLFCFCFCCLIRNSSNFTLTVFSSQSVFDVSVLFAVMDLLRELYLYDYQPPININTTRNLV